MGVSKTQLENLIKIILKDIVKPPIADLLMMKTETEGEVDCLIEFIKKNYTKEEVLAGLKEYRQCCEFAAELFGAKEKTNKKVTRKIIFN